MAERPAICEEFPSDMSLPPLQASTLQSAEAPAPIAGSFFNAKIERAPMDEITGIPLPIAPRSDINTLPSEATNVHHHFYPRLHPTLVNTLGGKALRVSRMQLVAATQHNFGHAPFHKFFKEGPRIPTAPAEQMGLVALSCAGYLPSKVVDTSSGEPIVRPMESWEHRRLSEPSSYVEPLAYQVKRFRDRRYPELSLLDAKERLITSRQMQASLSYKHLKYGFDPIKNFVVDYVLSQDVSDVQQETRRFLDQHDAESGLCLLAIASLRASHTATVRGRSLHTVYQELNDTGCLHRLMPPNASTLIKFKLGSQSHRLELLPLLRERLLEARESAVA